MLSITTRLLVLFALAATCLNVRGQFIIDMSQQVIGMSKYSFTVDSLILAFNGAKPIGYVLAKGSYEQQPACVRGNVDAALRDLLVRDKGSTVQEQHVVLKLNMLEISEQARYTQKLTSAAIHCEFLRRAGPGWERLYMAGTTIVRPSGHDTNNDHAQNITSALSTCLDRFQYWIRSGNTGSTELTTEQVFQQTYLDLPDYPSLTSLPFTRGVYWTYMDMLDNIPDTMVAFDLKTRFTEHDSIRTATLLGSYEEDLSHVWGLCDGQRRFINTGHSFNELRTKGDQLMTQWAAPAEYDGDDATTQLMFGLLGAILVWADESKTLQRFDLDLRTGRLVKHDPRAMEKRTGVLQVISFAADSPADTTICFYMQGAKKACLQRGQYNELRIPPQTALTIMELRIGEKTGERIYLDTEVEDWQFFEIRYDHGLVHVEHTPDGTVRQKLFELDPANEVK